MSEKLAQDVSRILSVLLGVPGLMQVPNLIHLFTRRDHLGAASHHEEEALVLSNHALNRLPRELTLQMVHKLV